MFGGKKAGIVGTHDHGCAQTVNGEEEFVQIRERKQPFPVVVVVQFLQNRQVVLKKLGRSQEIVERRVVRLQNDLRPEQPLRPVAIQNLDVILILIVVYVITSGKIKPAERQIALRGSDIKQ